jgi:hypothetical protein
MLFSKWNEANFMRVPRLFLRGPCAHGACLLIEGTMTLETPKRTALLHCSNFGPASFCRSSASCVISLCLRAGP